MTRRSARKLAPPTAAGYSGTPLARKLGLRPGMRCLLIDPQGRYPALVGDADGVRFLRRAREADVVHLFCRDQAALRRRLEHALERVGPDGFLWLSWPKKTSPLHADLSGNEVRAAGIAQGWVDIKVCAIDGDWSGLKFTRRRS